MRLEEDGGEKRPRMGTELPQHAQQQLLEALRASSAQPCVLPIGAPALVPPLPNPNSAPPPLRIMLAPAPAAAAAADGATAQTSAELALREMGFSADDAAFGAREAGGDVDAATLLLVSRIEAREQVLQIDAARVASEMDAEQRAELAAAEAREAVEARREGLRGMRVLEGAPCALLTSSARARELADACDTLADQDDAAAVAAAGVVGAGGDDNAAERAAPRRSLGEALPRRRRVLVDLLELGRRAVRWYGAPARAYIALLGARLDAGDDTDGPSEAALRRELEELQRVLFAMPSAGSVVPDELVSAATEMHRRAAANGGGAPVAAADDEVQCVEQLPGAASSAVPCPAVCLE